MSTVILLEPRNFEAGTLVSCDGYTGTLNGHAVTWPLNLGEEGYCELVLTKTGESYTVPICVVASSNIQVQLSRIPDEGGIVFNKLVSNLPTTNGKDSMLPAFEQSVAKVAALVNRAVVLDLYFIVGDNEAFLGKLVAKSKGYWESNPFTVTRGYGRVKAKVTIDTTLSL
jgi:hypothetical protein